MKAKLGKAASRGINGAITHSPVCFCLPRLFLVAESPNEKDFAISPGGIDFRYQGCQDSKRANKVYLLDLGFVPRLAFRCELLSNIEYEALAASTCYCNV